MKKPIENNYKIAVAKEIASATDEYLRRILAIPSPEFNKQLLYMRAFFELVEKSGDAFYEYFDIWENWGDECPIAKELVIDPKRKKAEIDWDEVFSDCDEAPKRRTVKKR